MFESQFFGYRKGAFTGAIHDEPGYFDQAHGGILFLDEILGWFMEYDRPGNVRELSNEVRRYTIMDEVELRSPGLRKPGRGGFHQADLLLSIHLALWVGKKGMFTISSVIKGSYRY